MKRIKQEINDIERFEEIIEIISREGCGYFLDKLNLSQHAPLIRRVTSGRNTKPGPERVRETFEELGPTFIKFGQILSERPDIIPIEYAQELEKLEDSVPAFDSEEARRIIDDEVGLEKFDELSEEPIAAASIAQVHEGMIDGEKVAVKVRRPGIKEKMKKDLDILTYFAKKADKHSDFGNHMLYRETKEFAEWTKKELDLEQEGRNIERFRENMENEDRIKIPETYLGISTEKVLVMEFIDAVKCNNVEEIRKLDVNEKELAKTGLRSFLKQLLRDGFIHMDPHPSNFMVSREGEMVYLDFGMMADITPKMQRNTGLLIMHTYNEDVDAVVETIKRMSYLENPDLEELERQVENMILDFRGTNLEQQSLSESLIKLARGAAENGVYMPTKFIMIGKGLVTMEGIGLKIYPDFEFDEEYEELVKELVLKNSADPEEMAESLVTDFVENKDLLTKLPSKINKQLEDTGSPKTEIIRDRSGENLLPPAIILGSLYLIAQGLDGDQLAILGGLGILLSLYLYRE